MVELFRLSAFDGSTKVIGKTLKVINAGDLKVASQLMAGLGPDEGDIYTPFSIFDTLDIFKVYNFCVASQRAIFNNYGVFIYGDAPVFMGQNREYNPDAKRQNPKPPPCHKSRDCKRPSRGFVFFRHINPFIKKFLYSNNITREGVLL